MKSYFSVGEAAKAAGITSETLRHYDRIGLIKPSKKDDTTNYRYYTEHDLIRINTIRALQQMDLPLQKIKEVLLLDDLEKIIDFMAAAEKKADEKIDSLKRSKSKIRLAKLDYENKLKGQHHADGIVIKHFPKRVILLSDTLKTPTLDNLWSYLRHFYDKVGSSQKEKFEFEDTAGIYSENGFSGLFAVCTRYENISGIRILPEGDYLCEDCTEEDSALKLKDLLQTANNEYNAKPEFTVQQIIVSGILQWKYQLQIYLG